jgi:hypothetical protein
MGAVDKLTWLRRVDECIAAGMVPHAFAHVAIRLATQRMNKRTGLAWPSPETLGTDIGMSASNVGRGLNAAVNVGLLGVVQHGRRGRGSHTAIYRLTMPKAEIAAGSLLSQISTDGDLSQAGRPPSEPSQISTGGDLDEAPKSPNLDPANPQICTPQIPTGGDEDPVRKKKTQERRGPARSADADRDSTLTDSATADDATPVESAPDGAPRQPLRAKSQPPSIASTQTELGTPANDADAAERWVQFLNVERRWPQGRIGDEDAAFRAFCKIMVPGRLWVFADAIEALAKENGDEVVPPLAEALASLRFP